MILSRQKIVDIAKKYDWVFVDFQENIGMISFVKSFWEIEEKQKRMSLDVTLGFSHSRETKCRINIYLTKGTVATSLKHPKYPKPTQLYRKNISYQELEKLFINPRQHTGKGYYTKK